VMRMCQAGAWQAVPCSENLHGCRAVSSFSPEATAVKEKCCFQADTFVGTSHSVENVNGTMTKTRLHSFFLSSHELLSNILRNGFVFGEFH